MRRTLKNRRGENPFGVECVGAFGVRGARIFVGAYFVTSAGFGVGEY